MELKDLISLDKVEEDNLAYNQNNIIINGDSLNVLKNISDNSVDLIFADPPYNIGKDFETNLDKWENIDSYVDWCKCWLDECMRILKDNGTFYFMTATQHMPYLDVYVSERYHVISRIIWSYDSSGVQSKRNLAHYMNQFLWLLIIKIVNSHLMLMIL
ncbi:DNA methyltransferase [Staphylococcus saprophyticus]